MKLRVKFLGLEAGGKSVVVLNREDAEDLGVSSLGRVRIVKKNKDIIAIVNTATKRIPRGTIGVYEEVRNSLDFKEGEETDVEMASFPSSVYSIRNKLSGRKLAYEEILEIIKDMVKGRISEIEIAA